MVLGTPYTSERQCPTSVSYVSPWPRQSQSSGQFTAATLSLKVQRRVAASGHGPVTPGGYLSWGRVTGSKWSGKSYGCKTATSAQVEATALVGLCKR